MNIDIGKGDIDPALVAFRRWWSCSAGEVRVNMTDKLRRISRPFGQTVFCRLLGNGVNFVQC